MTLAELYYLIRTEPVCLWLGAGFSSYAGYPTGTGLQKILFDSLEPHEKDQLCDTNSLSAFCEDYQALRGKDGLYQSLLEIFTVPPSATLNHDLLAKIPHFDTIITTNYDRMIESSYRAGEMAVIVNDSDVAAASKNQCHLYKIHGDIGDRGSLILTKGEYSSHYNRNFKDPFWASIIQVISSKHIIFLGYGYEDENIWSDFTHVHDRLLDKRKQRIMISRSFNPLKLRKLEQHRIVPIRSEIEPFLTGLEKDIRKNLVTDLKNKRVSVDTAIKFADRFGVDLKLITSPSGIAISDISKRDGPTAIQLQFEIQDREAIERYAEFKDSYKQMEFNLDNTAIKAFSLLYEGFEFLQEGEVEKVSILHVPSVKGKCTIEFPDRDYESAPFNYKFYDHAAQERLIVVKMLGFEIKLHFFYYDGGPKVSLSVKEPKEGGRTKAYLELFRILCWFLDGENVIIYRKGFDPVNHSFKLPGAQNKYAHYITLIEHIIQIEKYFNIKFTNIQVFGLDEDSLQTINRLTSLINFGTFRIFDDDGHTITDLPSDPTLREALKIGAPSGMMLYLSSPGSVSYHLFGKELELGTQMIGLKESQLVSFDEEAGIIKLKSSDDVVVYSYKRFDFGGRGETELIWGKD